MRYYYSTKWKRFEIPKDIQEKVIGFKETISHIAVKRIKRESFLKSPWYFADMVIILIHPLPYFDPEFSLYCININDHSEFIVIKYRIGQIFLAMMFFRIIFLVRIIFNFTMFTDHYAKRLW